MESSEGSRALFGDIAREIGSTNVPALWCHPIPNNKCYGIVDFVCQAYGIVDVCILVSIK